MVGTIQTRCLTNEELASTLCQRFVAYVQPDEPLKQCQRPLALHEKETKQQNGLYTQKQPPLPVKKKWMLAATPFPSLTPCPVEVSFPFHSFWEPICYWGNGKPGLTRLSGKTQTREIRGQCLLLCVCIRLPLNWIYRQINPLTMVLISCICIISVLAGISSGNSELTDTDLSLCVCCRIRKVWWFWNWI